MKSGNLRIFVLVVVLGVINIVTIGFLFRERMLRFGAELDALSMAMAAGDSMANADFAAGTHHLYEVSRYEPSSDCNCGPTGRSDCALEIWRWPCIPQNRATGEIFVERYNKRMKEVIAQTSKRPSPSTTPAEPASDAP